jgi:hypothetical protein
MSGADLEMKNRHCWSIYRCDEMAPLYAIKQDHPIVIYAGKENPC